MYLLFLQTVVYIPEFPLGYDGAGTSHVQACIKYLCLYQVQSSCIWGVDLTVDLTASKFYTQVRIAH